MTAPPRSPSATKASATTTPPQTPSALKSSTTSDTQSSPPTPPPTAATQSGIGLSPERLDVQQPVEDDHEEVYSISESYNDDNASSTSNAAVTPFDQLSNSSELSLLLDRAHGGRGSIAIARPEPQARHALPHWLSSPPPTSPASTGGESIQLTHQSKGAFYDPFAPQAAGNRPIVSDWTVDHTQSLANRARASFRKTSILVDPQTLAQWENSQPEAEQHHLVPDTSDEQSPVPAQASDHLVHFLSDEESPPLPPLPSTAPPQSSDSRPPTPPAKDFKETPTKQGPFCYSPSATREVLTGKPRDPPATRPVQVRHARSHSDPQVRPQHTGPLVRLVRQLSLSLPEEHSTAGIQGSSLQRKRSFLTKCNQFFRDKPALPESRPPSFKDKVAAALHQPFPPHGQERTLANSCDGLLSRCGSSLSFTSASRRPSHSNESTSTSAVVNSRYSPGPSATFARRPSLQRPPSLVLVPAWYNSPESQLETVWSDEESNATSPSFDLPSPLLLTAASVHPKPRVEFLQTRLPQACDLAGLGRPAHSLTRSRSVSHTCAFNARPGCQRLSTSGRKYSMPVMNEASRPSTSCGLPLRAQREQWAGGRSSTTIARPAPMESQPGFYDPRTRDRSLGAVSHDGHSFRSPSRISNENFVSGSSPLAHPEFSNMLDLSDDDDEEDEDERFFSTAGKRGPPNEDAHLAHFKRFSTVSQFQHGDDLPGAKARRVLGLNKDAGWEIGEGAGAKKAPTVKTIGFLAFARNRKKSELEEEMTSDAKIASHTSSNRNAYRLNPIETNSGMSQGPPRRPTFRRAQSALSTHSVDSAQDQQTAELSTSAGDNVPSYKLFKRCGSFDRRRPVSTSSSERSFKGDASSPSLVKRASQSSFVAPWVSQTDGTDVSRAGSKGRKPGGRRWWEYSRTNFIDADVGSTALRTSTALGLCSPLSANSLVLTASRGSSSPSIQNGLPTSRSLDLKSSSTASLPLKSSHSTQIPILTSETSMDGPTSSSPGRGRTLNSSSFLGNMMSAPRTSKALARVMMSPAKTGEGLSGGTTQAQRRRFDAVRKRLHNHGRTASASDEGSSADSRDQAVLESHVSLREKMLWERQLERGQRDACWQSMIEHRPRNRQVSSNAALEGGRVVKASSESISSKSSAASSKYGSGRTTLLAPAYGSPSSDHLVSTAATTPLSMATTLASPASSLDELNDDADATLKADADRGFRARRATSDGEEQQHKMYTGPSIEHLALHHHHDGGSQWPAWLRSEPDDNADDEVELLDEQRSSNAAGLKRPQAMRAFSDGMFTQQQLARNRREWPSPGEVSEPSDLDRYVASHSPWHSALAPSVSRGEGSIKGCKSDEQQPSPAVDDGTTECRRPSGASSWTVRAPASASLPRSVDTRRRDSDVQGVRLDGLGIVEAAESSQPDGRLVSLETEVEKAMAEEEVVDPHVGAGSDDLGEYSHLTRWQTASMWSQETQEVLATDEEEAGEAKAVQEQEASHETDASQLDSVGSSTTTTTTTTSFSSMDDSMSNSSTEEEGVFVILPPSPSGTSFLSLSATNEKDEFGGRRGGCYDPIPIMVDVPTPPRRLGDWPTDGDDFDEEDGQESEEEADQRRGRYRRSRLGEYRGDTLCV